MEKRLIDYDDLTKSEKIDHIWEYYKFHIIVGICLVLFVFSLLNHYIFNPPPEVTLDISVFGEYGVPDVIEELELTLQEMIIKDGENEEVLVDFFTIGEDQSYDIQQAMVTKMIGKATIHEFDIMVFEGDFFMNYLEENALLPLNDLVESGVIDVDLDQLKTASDFGLDDEKIYLIDISEHEGFKRMFLSDEPIYLAVFGLSEHTEHTSEALDYIINQFK